MRFLQKSRYCLCLLALALVVSCGDEDKGGNGDNGGNGGGPTGNSPLTPDQHKARLEVIGKDFVAQFNPNDHQTAAEAIDFLADIIDAPGLFDEDDYMKRTLFDIQSVITKNNQNSLTSLATRSNVDIYTLAEYAGVYAYNPSKKSWSKTDATGKISLEYNNGKSCALTMTFEGEKDYTQSEGTIVKVPAKTNFSMKVGGTEQVTASIETSLSSDQKSGDLTAKVSLIGGYKWELVLNAKSTVVTEIYKMSKNDKILMASTAKLTGNKLTNPDDIDSGEAGEMLANGEFDFRIMDVAITGKGDIKAMIDGFDKIPSTLPEKEEAQMQAAICNQFASMSLYYADNSEKVADVKMKAYYDGSGYEYQYNPQTGNYDRIPCEYYILMPELVFASDGSRLDIDTYFSEANFGSLIQSIETLVNKYADLVDADHVDL